MANGRKEWKYLIHIRDNFTCQHCGAIEDPEHPTFQIHHIVFKCRNGSDDPNNLLLTCPECHKYFYHGIGYPHGEKKYKEHSKYVRLTKTKKKRGRIRGHHR